MPFEALTLVSATRTATSAARRPCHSPDVHVPAPSSAFSTAFALRTDCAHLQRRGTIPVADEATHRKWAPKEASSTPSIASPPTVPAVSSQRFCDVCGICSIHEDVFASSAHTSHCVPHYARGRRQGRMDPTRSDRAQCILALPTPWISAKACADQCACRYAAVEYTPHNMHPSWRDFLRPLWSGVLVNGAGGKVTLPSIRRACVGWVRVGWQTRSGPSILRAVMFFVFTTRNDPSPPLPAPYSGYSTTQARLWDLSSLVMSSAAPRHPLSSCLRSRTSSPRLKQDNPSTF
ncbi:hypothetical protein C8J57DRAFT_1502582 [Mycena rebaudengoi]|nr:hypothetical protein C8J57DRAFT_1502582 [Mycena rebaudengoi]